MSKNKLRKGDVVRVISGSFSGKVTKITKVDRLNKFVYLEQIFREKFTKNNNKNSLANKISRDESATDKLPNKKKVFIPVNLSNVTKYDIENKE